MFAKLDNNATAEKHLIETMAGGVAAFDYDNDGDLDLFFANGARQPSLRKDSPNFYNRLYRNEGGRKFVDVTERAGLRGEGYSMGVATGDYDNDGDPDLFVAGVRVDLLYRNNGDGTFSVVKRTEGAHWSVGAGFIDYNLDGRLDLFVVRYVQWDPAKERFCGDAARNVRTYCHPSEYQGLSSALYRNEGNGTFTDVSRESGIGAHIGKGMAVAFADYDQDGDPDVFVTNDTVPNFLFRNEANGTFKEVGSAAGVALNDDGRALSSMGADWRDVNNDGRPDLIVTALMHETFPLFLNLGRGIFEDATYRSHVGRLTRQWSGWGVGSYDLDNDGFKDLITANGDVQNNTEALNGRPSKQRLAVLRQRGGTFEASDAPGPAALYRGVAFGDFDNDGKIDCVASRLGEPPVILWNETSPSGHWIRIKLEGTTSNRDGLGAVIRAGSQWNQATTAVGYASASEATVHFGLDAVTERVPVEIRWPSGKVQKVLGFPNRILSVREP